MKTIKLICIIAFFGICVSCTSSSNDDDIIPKKENIELIAAQNYYDNLIKPIIDNKCTTCHTGKHNKSDSFNYGTFSKTRESSSSIYDLVNSGVMPKGEDKLPQVDIDKFLEFKKLIEKIN